MRKAFTAHQGRVDKAARNPLPGDSAAEPPAARPTPDGKAPGKAKETGGPSGPEPTRYGDWERKGLCVDF